MPQPPRIEDLPNSTREACRIVDIFTAAFDSDPEPTRMAIAAYVGRLRVRANCASQKTKFFSWPKTDSEYPGASFTFTRKDRTSS
jgi:hypothetical protein